MRINRFEFVFLATTPVDLDGSLSGGGQGALGALGRGQKPPHRPGVAADVLLVLALELLRAAVAFLANSAILSSSGA